MMKLGKSKKTDDETTDPIIDAPAAEVAEDHPLPPGIEKKLDAPTPAPVLSPPPLTAVEVVEVAKTPGGGLTLGKSLGLFATKEAACVAAKAFALATGAQVYLKHHAFEAVG